MRRNNQTMNPPERWLPPRQRATVQLPDRKPPRRREDNRRKDSALAVSVAAGAAHTCEPSALHFPVHARPFAEDTRDDLERRRGGSR